MRARASRVTRVVIGGAVALAAALSLAALSQVPWTATAHEAELRLAWRARVPRVEECRRLTPEEQAELPVHMRRDEICEGRVASYRLEVRVDGEVRRRATVSGAGARGDRPLYVFETLPLSPGRHRVRVLFTRIDEGGATGSGTAANSLAASAAVPT